jgi:hypothetical protein
VEQKWKDALNVAAVELGGQRVVEPRGHLQKEPLTSLGR